jgi:branched-chain amino acid transport system permease protein
MVGLGTALRMTMFGKAVRAINDDEEVAKMVGIDTDRIIGQIFFVGSAIAGLAGILIGFDTGLEPAMGMGLLFKGVIASVIGGIGNIYGGVAGAFMLGFVENFGIWKLPSEWKDAIAFSVLLVFLFFRPQGIFNK